MVCFALEQLSAEIKGIKMESGGGQELNVVRGGGKLKGNGVRCIAQVANAVDGLSQAVMGCLVGSGGPEQVDQPGSSVRAIVFDREVDKQGTRFLGFEVR
jgi:hypothetical protein